MNNKHSIFSASASSRWLSCTASLKEEQKYENVESEFSLEGTKAHELCEKMLKNEEVDFNGDKEMEKSVLEYVDYVNTIHNPKTKIFIEERVSFSDFIYSNDEGFGTCDVIIVDEEQKTVHIVDFKYGKGILVDAENNTQLQMYALGEYLNCKKLGIKINTFKLHIVQPRKNNVSYFEISTEDLLKFGKIVKEKSKEALSKKPVYNPSEKNCKFCRASTNCDHLIDFMHKLITSEFEDIMNNDEKKKEILDNATLITNFITKLKKEVLHRVMVGEQFPGYRVVEGRSNRIWNERAEEFLKEKLGAKAFNKKLITITEAKKFMTERELSAFLKKPKGAPVLVQSDDKREDYNNNDIKFEEIKGK